ncbi:MAG: hypothetical protein Tsb0015_04760 [Simkaniaceae bacterium]
MDKFDNLLFELGKILNVELHPDQNRSCLMVINDEYRVQLEMDGRDDSLLFGSLIHEIPPGRFRENVLKDALKYNNIPPPQRIGTLGYIDKINVLSLFDFLEGHSLAPQKVADHLSRFIECLIAWKQALRSNLTSPPDMIEKAPKKPSIFDVRP